MQNYAKLQVFASDYDKIKDIQLQNKTDFREHTFGSRRNLYLGKLLLASEAQDANLDIGELTQPQFVSFLGMFKKHLYKQFLTNPDLLNLKIDFKGVARAKNMKYWDCLSVGSYFYVVDLSSAYWQMAYRLGYIQEKLFLQYMDVDSYKKAKRYCISFLARQNKMVYRMSDVNYEIHCDNSSMQRVYDNIRNELYTCLQKGLLGVSEWLEYNIDGVAVVSKDLDVVRNNLKSMGLTFKVTECRKCSETEYEYGSIVRKFKNR